MATSTRQPTRCNAGFSSRTHGAMTNNRMLSNLFANAAQIAQVATGLILLAFVKACYSRLTGKRGKVPGPSLNKLSVWPLRLATIQGRRVHYVDALHKKYGSIVQIAPDEIAISDIGAVKEIHRIGSGFRKSSWYGKFTQEASGDERDLGIFAMRDPRIHSVRRRLFANAFSKNALLEWEPVIEEKVLLAMKGIAAELETSQASDMLKWFTLMANDVISTLSFGVSLGNLEIGNKTPYIKDLETVMLFTGIAAELVWLAPILKLFSPRPRLDAKGKQLLKRAKSTASSSKAGVNIFDKMLAIGAENELSEVQIEREASNLLVAGSDTTARTLTYLIWAVMSAEDSSLRKQLRLELDDVPEAFHYADVADLPILNRIIQETLRLYGAAPGGLPREVPKGGRLLAGHFLDEGAVVSTQAFTLHRDPHVFKSPLSFNPDRWLQPTQQMKDAFMPFGAGTRVCIGLHLAHMELAMGAAYFFKRFDEAVKLHAQTTPASMQLENYFLVGPVSHQCLIARCS